MREEERTEEVLRPVRQLDAPCLLAVRILYCGIVHMLQMPVLLLRSSATAYKKNNTINSYLGKHTITKT